jgi:hypothetical protein
MERPRPDIDNVRQALRQHDEREADEPETTDAPEEDAGDADEQDDES